MDKKEIKARKKAYKKVRSKATRPWKWLTWISGPLAIILTAATVVIGMFDNTFALFLGGTFWEVVNEDPNAIYFSPEYKTEEERVAAGAELVKQVEEEGAALLTNENKALPLDKGAKVSLFSTSSVNIVYGGTGSGNVDSSKSLNLKQALEQVGGFEVNQTLWDFYLTVKNEDGELFTRGNAGAVVQDSATAGGYGSAEIVEVPWNYYEKADGVLGSIEKYGDAAIVVLSRIGGEGADSYFDHTLGDGKNYLALNDIEKEMMKNIKALKDAGKIDKIIVLINTSNALQVDFLKNNEYGVDATLWIGGVGQTGLEAVAEILNGTVNPSGSLPDTYCYDNYSSPVMQNFTPIQYTEGQKGDLSKIPEHADTYMIYQEGIYVGYKYYETRYEDTVMGKGNTAGYKYDDDVAFPFGYGLSYTTFEYSNMSLEYDKDTQTYTIKVTVTNKGDVAGKETVQIYVQSPYTQYDIDNKIEKASVQLVGFGKTQILEKGQSEELIIKVDGDYVASYDAYGAGTYILDAGDYYFTAATDSHNAVNNVLAAKGYKKADGMDADGNGTLVCKWRNEKLDTTTYATSDAGVKIENQLSESDPNLNDNVQDVVFLTRNDWGNTMPSLEKTVKLVLNEYLIKGLQDEKYNPDDYEKIEMPTLGADNGLKLYDMIGKEFDDPAWDKLLDQLTFDEMVTFIADAFHWHLPVESVQAPGTRDENGPQGLTVALFGSKLGVKTTALTSEDVLAATFNTELAYKIGDIVGEDCLAARVTFLYGPGANTHRSPYSGRNFEYYSEDSMLSSAMACAEVSGIEETNGVRVVYKHFALNDCEQDRIGLGVWLTEQAAREIYLRAFQGGLEDSQAGGNGVMMAYTRWGTTWSGSNHGLLKGILNGEWNCKGLQITDNVLNPMVNAVDGVLNGTTTFDSMMAFMVTDKGLARFENDPVVVKAMKEAAHQNLYAIANSQAMNGIGKDTTIKAIELGMIGTCRVLAIVFWLLFAVSLVLWILKRRTFNKTEEAIAYKEFRKTLTNK